MAASSLSYSSDCSEPGEVHSLLQQPNNLQLHNMRKKCSHSTGVKYRLPVIAEKGAILMIVWNCFFVISLLTCSAFANLNYGVQAVIVASSSVCYPLIGWLADSRFGKFKILRSATFLLLIAIILKSIGVLLKPNISVYLQYTSLLICSLAVACDLSCIIPFATDQSVGASAEQLSFTVHWLLWGLPIGYCIATFTFLLTGEYQEILQLFIAVTSFIIALVCLENCHHLLMTNPVISNPIKLIVQVLNYARKHKYPERRSALTYWEEDYPSRLDIGKDKYGGPFTFEQVEDVKTVLRLIPLVVCINIFNMVFWQKNHLMCYYSNCSSSYMSVFQFTSHHPPFYAALLHSAGLPIYYLFIFPLIRNFSFTIIRRIGVGMLLTILAYLASAIVELVEVAQSRVSTNTTCIFDTPISNVCPNSYKLLLIIVPELVKSMGNIIIFFSVYELIIAQSPLHIKGLLLCISSASTCVFIIAGFALNEFLTNIHIHIFPNCLFYYYLSYVTLGTLAFILYVLVAKWYKLRIRDDIVPYHMIAEEYFEREQANRSAFIEAQQLECSDEEYWKQ